MNGQGCLDRPVGRPVALHLESTSFSNALDVSERATKKRNGDECIIKQEVEQETTKGTHA